MNGGYKQENHQRSFMTFCRFDSDAAFTTQTFTFSPVVSVGSLPLQQRFPFRRLAVLCVAQLSK